MTTDEEQLKKDAERYRKLRALALKDGALEATVAICQLDFIATAEAFDAAVDNECTNCYEVQTP